jgi:hypothetical protein
MPCLGCRADVLDNPLAFFFVLSVALSLIHIHTPLKVFRSVSRALFFSSRRLLSPDIDQGTTCLTSGPLSGKAKLLPAASSIALLGSKSRRVNRPLLASHQSGGEPNSVLGRVLCLCVCVRVCVSVVFSRSCQHVTSPTWPSFASLG